MNPCLLIPIYDHEAGIAAVLEGLAPHRLPCLVIDDGSHAPTRRELERLAEKLPWVEIHRLPSNQGKGAALKAGYRLAAERGFSHAIQLDADGQHDPAEVPLFLAAIAAQPDALVLGDPQFDDSAPRLRIWARQLSRVSIWGATRSFAIRDPLCGFRAIPLEPALRLIDRVSTGDRMEFEPEFAARLYQLGVPVRTVPTKVIYPEGGVSHFSFTRDYSRLTAVYARLLLGSLLPFRGARKSDSWARIAERGSLGALRVGLLFHRVFGRRLTYALLHPIAAYFMLTQPWIRAASRDYFEALHAFPGGPEALGGPPGLRHVFRHTHAFATNVTDRLLLWGGRIDSFEIRHRGSEHLYELARAGRGAILLGSHIGSFDMMRLLATQKGRLRVNVLMYTRNAERLNSVLDQLDPTGSVRVIQMEPDSLKTAFVVKRCIERGEFVGILADRVDAPSRERLTQVSFLGRPARFPLAPFLLSQVLRCPLLVSLCVRVGRGTYETVVEPIGDGTPVPRAEREKRALELLTRYVEALEAQCLRTPYEWFNFYDFWRTSEEVS